mgnify:CR=1 FL=1
MICFRHFIRSRAVTVDLFFKKKLYKKQAKNSVKEALLQQQRMIAERSTGPREIESEREIERKKKRERV